MVGMVAVLVLAAVPLVESAARADGNCDPRPIGRCGNYQHETVPYCYVGSGSYYARSMTPVPTRTDAVEVGDWTQLGLPVPVPVAPPAIVYVTPTPTEQFANDPYHAPLPTGSVFAETNLVAGLQTVPFKCTDLWWFADCTPPSWMWLGTDTDKAFSPDKQIV
jgi:hypothetical protein